MDVSRQDAVADEREARFIAMQWVLAGIPRGSLAITDAMEQFGQRRYLASRDTGIFQWLYRWKYGHDG